MDGIEDIEVDVQLFITCRMCLDEPGVYQIVPSIKELIKDCFDIDTDPFDGLPQLICKKCKSTLSDYHGVKTLFKLKQLKLRERIAKSQSNTQPKSETVDTNKKDENGQCWQSSPTLPNLSHAFIAPIEPVASADPVTPTELGVQTTLDNINQVIDDTWKRTYNEHYFCKICTKSYQKFAAIKKHVKAHKKMLKKHKKVFRKYCSVQLNKADDKANCIGEPNLVVYSSDKIIASKQNSHYYALYLKKESDKQTTNKNAKSSDKRPGILFDYSEDENIKTKKKKTNTTEPGARDTRVTNADSENIFNSAFDAAAETFQQRPQAKSTAKVANYKAIQNIVTMCHNKHIKKVQATSETPTKPTVSESSLKHKVLSLGRKVINRQGFECTGLLRYMEHKDLEISWQPASRVNKNRKSNFVRIMPKLKSREDLESDDTSWKDLNKIKYHSDQVIGDDVNDNNIDSIETANTKSNKDEKSTHQPELTNGDESDKTNNCDNKLLNKTPVANPKQLPKKTADINPTIIIATDPAMPLLESDEPENAEIDDSHLCMPIITSTQSLSTVSETVKQKDPIIDKPAPRIKVKPPSELMSQRALNNQGQLEDIWAFDKRHACLPHHLSNTTLYSAAPMIQSQPENRCNDRSSVVGAVTYPNTTTTIADNQENNLTNLRDDKNLEYVTLHCLELPNEKTKFPFQYFKRVLQCHGFELWDTNEPLPAQFTCLVSFKLLLKQDTIRPLGVWSSLFCANNSFCFAFKDNNLRKFNPNQLPAFWQWELLKIYKGDVVNKVLANSLKISKEVHGYTNNFLCLLKSIRCISPQTLR